MRALLSLLLLTAAAGPATAALPDPAGVFRYELRALGALAGEAVLTIGQAKVAGKRTVRKVRIEARTAGLAARLHKATGDGTAIVNANYQPLRVDWKADSKGNTRDAKVTIGPRAVTGLYRRMGQKDEPVAYKTSQWSIDAVSAYVWVGQQDLTVGHSFERPFFDGRKLGTLAGTVGEAKNIHVPLGLRKAIPVRMVVRRPGKSRNVTFWIGEADRLLYRIEVEYGILNTVRADLVGLRR